MDSRRALNDKRQHSQLKKMGHDRGVVGHDPGEVHLWVSCRRCLFKLTAPGSGEQPFQLQTSFDACLKPNNSKGHAMVGEL